MSTSAIVLVVLVVIFAAQWLFRAVLVPADPERVTLRLKGPNFIATLNGIDPGAAASVVHFPFVGDLSIVLALESRVAFRMLGEADLARMTLSRDQALDLARQNVLERAPAMHFEELGPLRMAVLGDSMEAATMTLDAFWDSIAREMHGELRLGVPARDILLFTDSATNEAEAFLREAIDEAYVRDSTHCLTRAVFTRRDGQWVVVEPAA